MIPVTESSVTHADLSLTTGRLLEWDADHHTISFPGLLNDVAWAWTHHREVGWADGSILGWTGWGKRDTVKKIGRKVWRTRDELVSMCLRSDGVKAAIDQEANVRNKSRKTIRLEAKQQLLRMASTLSQHPPRTLAYVLRKGFRKLFEKIRVDHRGLAKVRELARAHTPMVLLPTHRSYVDFLFISYIFFAHNLPLPYIAAGDDFLPLEKLLRDSGAFFIKRSNYSPLYASLVGAYVQALLKDGNAVEIFVEGKRSRTGTFTPQIKRRLLRMCLQGNPDVRVVPISIDYERTVEASLYSDEAMGVVKKRETPANLIKAVAALSVGKRGALSGAHPSVWGYHQLIG